MVVLVLVLLGMYMVYTVAFTVEIGLTYIAICLLICLIISEIVLVTSYLMLGRKIIQKMLILAHYMMKSCKQLFVINDRSLNDHILIVWY